MDRPTLLCPSFHVGVEDGHKKDSLVGNVGDDEVDKVEVEVGNLEDEVAVLSESGR